MGATPLAVGHAHDVGARAEPTAGSSGWLRSEHVPIRDGMAYIIERKNRFYVVAYDGIDPATGRERRRWHPAGHSRTDAEAIAARLDAIDEAEGDVVATQLRFGRYLTERFMPMRRQRLQSTTAYRYEWMIEHYINPVLGSMPLRSVRSEHLGRLYNDLLTTGALRLVAEAFHEGDCDVLAGACFCQYDEEPQRSEVRSAKREGWERIPYHAAIWQPSCYFRRSIVGRGDLVLRDMHYCMDRELWCHLFQQGARWKWTEDVLSHYRFTGANKSVVGGSKIIDEISRIFEGHVPDADRLPHLLRRYWLPAVLKSEKASGPMKPVFRGVSKSVAACLLARFPKEHVRALQREFYSYSVWG